MADLGSDPENDGRPPADVTVFLSYSRADRTQALDVLQLLESAGFSVWWDGLLEGGVRFHEATETALKSARAVVVLWSPSAIQSHWVHDEASWGRDTGRLVPLLLGGVAPPLGFGQFQSIDIGPGLGPAGGAAAQKIVQAVAALTGREARAVAGTVAARPFVSRRVLLAGGGVLALAGGGLALWRSDRFSAAPTPNSIAVLPFANLSGDPEQRYFSDGLTAEIRAQLSRNALLQIVGPTSSDAFRDHRGDARTIAAQLGVAFLLDGNVQKAGARIKTGVDLTDGRTGLSRWSATFERPAADIFAVQTEIAAALASELSIAMDESAEAAAKARPGGTTSVAAFDAYLRGRDLYEAGVDENSDRQALAKFDEAIAYDPRYAGAHAARSRSLAIIGNLYADHDERVRLYDTAVAAAQRATGLSADFAEGFSALGFALASGQLDMRAARIPYERSYQLGSGDADILSRYATFRSNLGDGARALGVAVQAAALDPLNPRAYRSIGDINHGMRNYAAAIEAYGKAVAINPGLAGLNSSLGFSQYMLGKLDEAAASFAREKANVRRLTGAAIIDWRRGKQAEARATLAALVAEYGEKSNYQYAQIHAQWGESAAALQALAKARDLRDGGIMLMYADPLLDPIRGTAEFSALVRAIGFL